MPADEPYRPRCGPSQCSRGAHRHPHAATRRGWRCLRDDTATHAREVSGAICLPHGFACELGRCRRASSGRRDGLQRRAAERRALQPRGREHAEGPLPHHGASAHRPWLRRVVHDPALRLTRRPRFATRSEAPVRSGLPRVVPHERGSRCPAGPPAPAGASCTGDTR